MCFKALCKPPSYARKRKAAGVTKILFVMRLTGIFVLAAMLHVSAAGRAQSVTYSARSAPLTQVFLAIEQQTGYNVFYDVSDLQGARLVTVDWKATPLRDALTNVLAGQPLAFEIQGNTIFVTKKGGNIATAGSSATARRDPWPHHRFHRRTALRRFGEREGHQEGNFHRRERKFCTKGN